MRRDRWNLASAGIVVVAGALPEPGLAKELWGNGKVATKQIGPCVPVSNKSSVVQTSLGLSINGYGAQQVGDNRLADDFSVPPGVQWRIEHMSVPAYQNGAAPGQSPINYAGLRIWQGVPGEGGVIVWDSGASNLLCQSWFAGVFRHSDVNCSLDRAVFDNMLTLSPAPILPPGEYWVDIQLGGQLPSGPWVPPVTYDGLSSPSGANARQYQSAIGQWVPVTDPGYPKLGIPQELPFHLYGEELTPKPTPACPGDIDGDGTTGQPDLGILLASYSACSGDPGFNPAADLDGDGCIGQGDLGILLANYGCAMQKIVAVGMAWDGDDPSAPATISHLWNTTNVCWLAPGDVILEYRGVPISNGPELTALVQALPDVAPGETVPMLVLKHGTGVPMLVEPNAFAFYAPANTQEDFKTVFIDRRCETIGDTCECETTDTGKTCIRILHVEYGADGKIVKTWASCADGANICPKPAAPEKKKKDGK